MKTKRFTKEEAVQFLMEQEGWNFYGAEAIVDMIPEGLFETITKEELVKISEDYKDR